MNMLEDLITQTKKEREEGLLELGNYYLNIIKQYNLLDNLVDIDLVKNLDNKQLYDLYKLMVLDLGVNIGITKLENNLLTRTLNKEADESTREEILTDIANMLNHYNKTLGKPLQYSDITMISRAKSEQKFLDFTKLIKMLLGNEISNELAKLLEQIKNCKELLVKNNLA